jgi:hypothetical protein
MSKSVVEAEPLSHRPLAGYERHFAPYGGKFVLETRMEAGRARGGFAEASRSAGARFEGA